MIALDVQDMMIHKMLLLRLLLLLSNHLGSWLTHRLGISDLWLLSNLQTANNKVDKQSDYMTIRDQCIAIFIQLLHLWTDEVVETASFVVSIVRGLSIYRLALTNEHDAERITSTAHHLKL